MRIHGVGKVKADEWYRKGYRTLDDLKNNPEILSSQQRLGLHYFEDFEQRIPRQEVEQIALRVTKACLELDEFCEATVTGSYRRGKADCGDIDILMYSNKPNHELSDLFLHDLVEKLTKSKLLIGDLGKASNETHSYHGIARLEQHLPARRIDFLVCKYRERGAALLHFTGNDSYNRNLRNLAGKKGYSLSQHGLVKRDQDDQGQNEWIAGHTEKDIVDILGVRYLSPEERNFA